MYTKIVVGTDGSDTASQAVLHAANLARTFGATLHLVSAYKRPGSVAALAAAPEAILTVDDSQWRYAAESETTKMLDQAAASFADVKVVTHVEAGDPVRAICSVADVVGADLVVVGNKGMKGARRLLGSVPNSVAHSAPCSVLVVETTGS